jgi:hypothetical protein
MNAPVLLAALNLMAAGFPAEMPREPGEMQIAISMTAYEPVTGTYTAEVHIHAAPCHGVTYDLTLPVSRVRSSADAQVRLRDALQRIRNDINHEAADRCAGH